MRTRRLIRRIKPIPAAAIAISTPRVESPPFEAAPAGESRGETELGLSSRMLALEVGGDANGVLAPASASVAAAAAAGSTCSRHFALPYVDRGDDCARGRVLLFDNETNAHTPTCDGNARYVSAMEVRASPCLFRPKGHAGQSHAVRASVVPWQIPKRERLEPLIGAELCSALGVGRGYKIEYLGLRRRKAVVSLCCARGQARSRQKHCLGGASSAERIRRDWIQSEKSIPGQA